MASTTMKAVTLPNETVWLDKATYDKAERQHYEKLAKGIQESTCSIHSPAVGSLANEVAKARDHIKQSLQCMDDIAALAHVSNQDLTSRIDKLEKENQELKVAVHFLKSMIETLRCSMKNLVSTQQNMERFMEQHTEVCSTKVPLEHFIAVCPAKLEDLENHTIDNDNENFDLSMSNSDNLQEEGEIREDRLVECNAKNIKKSHKTCQIPKSVIIMDVKPWDDKTDVEEMEKEVRKIKKDGLVWGASTIAPLAFGIKKLQISCVVEDDKVSIDCLIDEIKELNKYVQSVDIVAFNKV